MRDPNSNIPGKWFALASLALMVACSERGPTLGHGESGGDIVSRGRYLVEHAAGCGDCHSPRGKDGAFDARLWLGGIDCLIDVAPDDPTTGCVATPNLTDHETGLRNRSDQEIKDAFLTGERPDGKALHPLMPYWMYGNMHQHDADAIVAYLRTVKGVTHMVAASQPPFLAPERATPRVPDAMIPMPRADYPDRAAALRGRYLAGTVAGCVDCHTPRGPKGEVLLAKAFQGGTEFPRELLRLPASLPAVIYSPNLTPHATGIRGYSVADVVRALKHGEDRNQGGAPLCPPMPSGPTGPFGGMTDADASDIGHYLLSIPPVDNAIPADCMVPEPGPAHSDTPGGSTGGKRG